ncbi:MAG: class I SAM-dependent methyltransferase [Saprospiraceae bacterium]|nr:class I SAM-dependent methyltransferase [Saprospiraceae bacterium]
MRWTDYSLLDCGDQEKLERFGAYILRRPEPQAIWKKQYSSQKWDNWDASFSRTRPEQAGGWKYKSNPLQPWWIKYDTLNFQLQCTSFGHVGLFPEQIANWQQIKTTLSQISVPSVLNLFAYTGAASLVARQAGADVVHVDAVPNMIQWARTNMEQSRLKDIRWVVEDVMRFVQREVRRNKAYDAIFLDPPAYGRGPKGEKWMLPDQLDELLACCAKLSVQKGQLILLNMYSMGFSPRIAEQLLKLHFPGWKIRADELCIPAESGVVLPLGICALGMR